MKKIIFLFLLVLFISSCVNVKKEGLNQNNQEEQTKEEIKNSENLEIQEQMNNNQEISQENKQNENLQEEKSEDKISLSELLKHNARNDCWIAYDKKVYDVTDYLGKHPGGIESILKYCGTADEFQISFTKKHGTSKNDILFKQKFIGYLE